MSEIEELKAENLRLTKRVEELGALGKDRLIVESDGNIRPLVPVAVPFRLLESVASERDRWKNLAETAATYLWDVRAFLETTDESPAAVERITDDLERIRMMTATRPEVTCRQCGDVVQNEDPPLCGACLSSKPHPRTAPGLFSMAEALTLLWDVYHDIWGSTGAPAGEREAWNDITRRLGNKLHALSSPSDKEGK